MAKRKGSSKYKTQVTSVKGYKKKVYVLKKKGKK